MMSHIPKNYSYAGVEVVAVEDAVVGSASPLSTGWGAVLGLVRPRFCRSCDNHFFVVLSSFRVFANMLSFSWSGRQDRSASRAL